MTGARRALLPAVLVGATLAPAGLASATVERQCGTERFAGTTFQAQQVHTGDYACAGARRLIAAEVRDGRGSRSIGCPAGWRCVTIGNGGKELWRRGAARISFYDAFG